MEITISSAALNWFKEEVGVGAGDKIRFYAMVYGTSPVQENFALGFSVADPVDAVASKEAGGILFFVDETDLWFFNGHNLHVDYNEARDEVEYSYSKAE